MSDIINRAKRLLDDSTPGPWEWVGYDLEQVSSAGSATVLEFQCVTEFGMVGAIRATEVTPEDEELIAAAPVLARALAEETWEYGVTYIGVKHGGHHIEWAESTGDAEFDKDTLQRIVKRGKKWGQSPKIVRRRVSLPGVVG